jgi:hypothetical protein
VEAIASALDMILLSVISASPELDESLQLRIDRKQFDHAERALRDASDKYVTLVEKISSTEGERVRLIERVARYIRPREGDIVPDRPTLGLLFKEEDIRRFFSASCMANQVDSPRPPFCEPPDVQLPANEMPRQLLDRKEEPFSSARRALTSRWSQALNNLKRVKTDNEGMRRQQLDHLGRMKEKMDTKIERIVRMHERETEELIAAYEKELQSHE